ncbi:MAG: FKBP-type peptidyl-prolyl cis-trans isomerase [Crocinitomicaceae bacterium]|nr:FKBP-type peptidyl-prolyl cis-trans isomerase [Crocinitomicaceae bacterium]
MDDNFVKDASYALGMNVAGNLAQQNLDKINVDEFAAGLKAVFNGETPRLDQENAGMLIQKYIQEISEQAYKVFKEEGENFLAENAKRDEVKVTESGLQYEVIEKTIGETPTATSQVTVHYKGTLLNGSIFDSSYQRNQPATFGLNQVIKGWTEGLQLMSKGSKFKFYIPQELAYGTNPQPNGPIKPYMALIFEVELIDIA